MRILLLSGFSFTDKLKHLRGCGKHPSLSVALKIPPELAFSAPESKKNAKENCAVSPLEEPEPSIAEMRAFLFREHPTTIKRRHRRIIQSIIIGLLVGVIFRVAWNYGIIAFVSAIVWKYCLQFIAGWKELWKVAFP